MLKKTHNLIVLLLVLAISNLQAQSQSEKALAQAESGVYGTSIESYKDYLLHNPKDYKVCLELADVLVTSGRYTEAESYFNMIPEDAPEYKLMGSQYVSLLKKMGRYNDVPVLLADYFNTFPDQQTILLKNVENAIAAMSKPAKYDIVTMPSNSRTSDFGLTFYNNIPVFSSLREDILMDEIQRESNSETPAHKTFKYNAAKNRMEYITGINSKINRIGPVSYAQNVSKCAYIETKLNEHFNMDKDFRNASVHIATLNENGEMTSSKPFPYNEMGSSINSIFLSADGNTLYFASDRQGGFGGFDLYKSQYNNGKWSNPENLGPEVNSIYNEITPHFFNNTIYFASDDPNGLGGYDIYSATFTDGKWQEVIQLEREINSPEDDFFPAFNAGGDMFFTSSRTGGSGMMDIYKSIVLESSIPQPIANEIPKAVSLEELARETQKHTVKDNNNHAVSLSENDVKTTSFTLPVFDPAKVGPAKATDDVLSEAHRTAVDELVPLTEVFFIQLASMSAVKPNYSKFKPLLRLGNVYRIISGNTIKIKLGYFSDRKEAEDVLAKVKASGFNDAFITLEILNTAQMELMLSSKDDKSFSDAGNFNTSNKEVINEYKAANKYKVRLASYEDPIWFEVNKVKDLGRVEQWTKGTWTIFILAGYTTYEEAKRVQMQAYNRGFKTAEVVVDNNGILERIQQN